MKIFWVTSFNEGLYDHSGFQLVHSFREQRPVGKLICSHEEIDDRKFSWTDLGGYDLECDCKLNEWEKKYRKKFKDATSIWNQRAGGWARKAFTLDYVESYYRPDIMIWIDCDCVFKRPVTEEWLLDLFGDAGLIYLYGKKRRWTETGIMAFNFKHSMVKEFLSRFRQVYYSGDFLGLERWDDCTIFDHVRKQMAPHTFRDVAAQSTSGRVVENSAWAPYIEHKKGSHNGKWQAFGC